MIQTPWGVADHTKEIAAGITWHSTPSHGGYHLSPERVAEMREPLRSFKTFAGSDPKGGKWYEEDCDWAIVALAFPQFFPQDAVEAAHASMRNWKPELYKQVAGEHALRIMAESAMTGRGTL